MPIRNALATCHLLLVFPLFFYAQTQILPFQLIRAGSGQDINFIYNITQDRQGFLWFGTLNGLVRYDGYNYKNYNHVDGSGLKGKRVNGVEEDQYGRLWVVSGRWLQVYDPAPDSFYSIDNLDGDTIFNYTASIVNPIMVKDSQGIIWMRSTKGLFRIEPHQEIDKSTITLYHPGPGGADSSGNFNVQVVFPDSQNRLWVGDNRGLYLFNQEKDRLEQHSLGMEARIITLCESLEGRICVGMVNEGFGIYDPATHDFSRFVHNEKDTTSLARESVFQIARDGKGNIWLLAASFGKQSFSLQRFDPATGIFQTYYQSQKPKGIASISIFLFKNRAGQIWILGKGGLMLYDPGRDELQLVRDREKHAINWSKITTIYEDRTGVIWIGTLSTGVLKFAPSNSKFDIFKPDPQGPGYYLFSVYGPVFEDSRGYLWLKDSDGTGRYIPDDNGQLREVAHYPFYTGWFLEDSRGILWLTTFEGTKYFDLKAGKFFQLGDEALSAIPGLKELEDNDGWIWAKTRRGLFRFNPVTGEVLQFRHDPDDPNSVNSNRISGRIIMDSDGDIWVGNMSGLNKYHPETGNFSSYLDGIQVTDVHECNPGSFWITTEGLGFYHLDINTGETREYSKKDGFPTNRALFILEDSHGGLWISSDVGLIHFQADTETWKLYDEQDGLPISIFTYGELRRKNGEMFFPLWGGGYAYFHPDSLRDDPYPPRTSLVDFQLFNKPVEIGGENSPLATSIWMTDHIVLHHNQNVFSLEYTAFHFAAPEQNEFAYQMEGVDPDWQYVGNRRIVNFAGLQSGEYTFRVKAANHDGLWGEEKALQITILPPWWATWWAYCLYALATAGLLWAVYTWRRRRWQLKAQLAMEHQEAERLKELDQFKTDFYTNITHEFRTPLTIILGMVEQVKSDPQKWYNEGLQMIKRSGRNLLRLVNQMLDLSKLEAGVLPVNMVQGDVIAYLKYVLESFHSLAESKNIELGFHSGQEELVMDYDPEKMREIVSNLLSNAIKFTPVDGTVEVAVSALEVEGGRMVAIAVKDNGIGIPEEELDKVFGRFYKAPPSPPEGRKKSHPQSPQGGEGHSGIAANQGASPSPSGRAGEGLSPSGGLGGAGIGLALTQELVKLLGGKIEAKSEPGKGSVFNVLLPIRNEASVIDVERSDIPTNVEAAGKEGSSTIASATAPAGRASIELQYTLLIIEDNMDVVRYLSSLLNNEYRLEVAENGKEGLEKALETIPDIILSDVMMPEMDGFELCGQLKKDFRTSHIPIILLTAKADMPSRIEGLERGADAYLAKPFHKEELLVRLHKLLESRRQLQERYRSLPPLPPAKDQAIQFEDNFMQRVRDTLEAHLSDEYFGILDLCKELGMSRPQLYRKFKALSGQPVGQYFRSLRLNKAKALLLSTEMHISEISYEVGFKDPSYFTRVFKEEFGVTPGELRK